MYKKGPWRLGSSRSYCDSWRQCSRAQKLGIKRGIYRFVINTNDDWSLFWWDRQCWRSYALCSAGCANRSWDKHLRFSTCWVGMSLSHSHFTAVSVQLRSSSWGGLPIPSYEVQGLMSFLNPYDFNLIWFSCIPCFLVSLKCSIDIIDFYCVMSVMAATATSRNEFWTQGNDIYGNAFSGANSDCLNDSFLYV